MDKDQARLEAAGYEEAVQLCDQQLASSEAAVSWHVRLSLLLQRSACLLKLKKYEKVIEDCTAILELESNNAKALTRKIKALNGLGHFYEAYKVATKWKEADPKVSQGFVHTEALVSEDENAQAKREYDRLQIIINALQDQDGEDEDGFTESESHLEMAIVPTQNSKDGADHDTTNHSTDSSTVSVVPTQPASVSLTNGVALQSIGTTVQPSTNRKSAMNSTPSASSSSVNTSAKVQNDVIILSPKEAKTSDAGQKERPSYACTFCDISFGSHTELRAHCASDLHKKKITSDDEHEWKFRPPPRGLTAEEYVLCPRYFSDGMCKFGQQCSQAHTNEELDEWRQRFEYRKQKVQKAKECRLHSNTFAEELMERYMSSDNPYTIMCNSIEGVKVHVNSDLSVTMTNKRSSHAWMFTITSKFILKQVVLLDDASRSHFNISSITVGPKKNQKAQKIGENCQEWLHPQFDTAQANMEKVYRVKVSFKTNIYGTMRQTVVFDFNSEPMLCQQLCADAVAVTDVDKLAADLVLSEGGRWDLAAMTLVKFTPKPAHLCDSDESRLLETYPAPMAASFSVSSAVLEANLTSENYRQRMHGLLYIEEMAQFSSIAKYNVKTTLQIVDRFLLMPSTVSTAKFAQNGELFARMKLCADISEDLSYGRLILQNVNTVYLAPEAPSADSEQKPAKVYEALVEEKGKNFLFVRLSRQTVDDLGLAVDQDFPAEVQLHLNRRPLCEMHLAVDSLPLIELVFPALVAEAELPWNNPCASYDGLDSRCNAKQKEAVVAITSHEDGIQVPPILLVGPYGTGKTFTLAQAAIQAISRPDTKVLICTHSNSAADLYIKDYFHPYVEDDHPDAKPLRILYSHRWIQTVNPTVLQYCLRSEDGASSFRKPVPADILQHRIVVTTLSTSRYLYDLQLQPGIFTHILLDEAAQAQECETIMPLALANPNTRVVLAGDHMQLSPEVHSDFARERHLHVSFLERLYDLYPEANPCRIMLCENYRSHKAIIDFTSELFYDKKLISSGDQPPHDVFYPLSFFTARGEDIQHQNSTAFYNNAEVYEIVERVCELQKMWPKCWGKQEDSSIGVVAPYADQVSRIRSELRKRKLYNVSVERVLNVQGKQYRAILLSTVRTRHTCSADSATDDFMDYGFLSNAKLLNTAITRAQSLVAVVGDPVSLCSIGKCRKLWEHFIETCHKQNSLHGITWNHLRAQLDGVEMKKTYILNPLAPEFIPNRLRHGPYIPPEPVAVGKFGHMFSNTSHNNVMLRPQLQYSQQIMYPYLNMPVGMPGLPYAHPKAGAPAIKTTANLKSVKRESPKTADAQSPSHAEEPPSEQSEKQDHLNAKPKKQADVSNKAESDDKPSARAAGMVTGPNLLMGSPQGSLGMPPNLVMASPGGAAAVPPPPPPHFLTPMPGGLQNIYRLPFFPALSYPNIQSTYLPNGTPITRQHGVYHPFLGHPIGAPRLTSRPVQPTQFHPSMLSGCSGEGPSPGDTSSEAGAASVSGTTPPREARTDKAGPQIQILPNVRHIPDHLQSQQSRRAESHIQDHPHAHPHAQQGDGSQSQHAPDHLQSQQQSRQTVSAAEPHTEHSHRAASLSHTQPTRVPAAPPTQAPPTQATPGDPQVMLPDAHLQQEIYRYLLQTEGRMAADVFLSRANNSASRAASKVATASSYDQTNDKPAVFDALIPRPRLGSSGDNPFVSRQRHGSEQHPRRRHGSNGEAANPRRRHGSDTDARTRQLHMDPSIAQRSANPGSPTGREKREAVTVSVRLEDSSHAQQMLNAETLANQYSRNAALMSLAMSARAGDRTSGVETRTAPEVQDGWQTTNQNSGKHSNGHVPYFPHFNKAGHHNYTMNQTNVSDKRVDRLEVNHNMPNNDLLQHRLDNHHLQRLYKQGSFSMSPHEQLSVDINQTASNGVMNDLPPPTPVERMVRFIEESIDQQCEKTYYHKQQNNKHAYHHPTRLSQPSNTHPQARMPHETTDYMSAHKSNANQVVMTEAAFPHLEDAALPLYMRGPGDESQPSPASSATTMSYANALRRPQPSPQHQDYYQHHQQHQNHPQNHQHHHHHHPNRHHQQYQPHHLQHQHHQRGQPHDGWLAAASSSPLSGPDDVLPDPSCPEVSIWSMDRDQSPEDPLDLLKNLNIKASPGTQAFYQYFS